MDSPIVKELANGYKLRYSYFGSGDCLIFLHGYPENHSVWLPLMQQLSHQFSVLAFDWPGMGGSETWKGGSTPKSMASRIITIMDSLDIKNASLVGHDMGGQPALVCASEFPDRIKSVTVINSLLIHDAKTSWEIRYLRNLSLNTLIIKHLPKLVYKRALSTFNSTGSALTPELRSEIWNYFKRKSVREYVVRMCHGYQAQLPKLARYYTKIKCPVLILWSEDNKHFDIDHGKQLQKLVETTEMEVLEGSSHWLGLTETEKVATLISGFITK